MTATYVVTGANTGVGRATAVALAARHSGAGARLVLVCRSADRTRAVLEQLETMPGASAELVRVDLGDLDSVRRGADTILRAGTPIDALINNAGVGGARGQTADGFELAFGVNYLGHYLLTRRLLPLTRRVVHVTSGSHRRVRALDLGALRRSTRSWTGVREYSVSKLCTMLFHHELARRGSHPPSLAADPGDVASEGFRHVPWPIRPMLTRGMKPPSEGAKTSVFCATAAGLASASGHSFVDCREDEPSPLSQDHTLAEELWDRSASWVGLA